MATALCTLDAVKEWLGVKSPDSDSVLTRLLASTSAAILSQLNRENILPTRVVETYSGSGQTRMLLRSFPVTAVARLEIDGVAIPVASRIARTNQWEIVSDMFAIPDAFVPSDVFSIMSGAEAISVGDLKWEKLGAGYTLEYQAHDAGSSMNMMQLSGYRFSEGISNIVVDYTAGYRVSSEPHVVPSATEYTVTVDAPYGPWASDMLVCYTTREPMTKVSGAPTQGQYSVAAGVYTFSADDASQAIEISYGYVPGDIEQAAIEWVAERFKYRERIGMRSKSLGGQETISYDNSAVPKIVEALLNNYKRVVPC